ncbi:hypothetical protein [Nocardia gipuzkoensis]|uniref:hypothetical protein n=1 Tax=Nocardia gipuzkoensis TaxID=2749991 RepID=UPI0015EF8697|nr:hypothetical protein [Nocardia gipuzkoensis]
MALTRIRRRSFPDRRTVRRRCGEWITPVFGEKVMLIGCVRCGKTGIALIKKIPEGRSCG